MKRWTAVALAAATLLSATAIAETLGQAETQPGHPSRTTAYSDEADEAYVPSVNIVFEGQSGGAFVLP
jgi:hypothetical protein